MTGRAPPPPPPTTASPPLRRSSPSSILATSNPPPCSTPPSNNPPSRPPPSRSLASLDNFLSGSASDGASSTQNPTHRSLPNSYPSFRRDPDDWRSVNPAHDLGERLRFLDWENTVPSPEHEMESPQQQHQQASEGKMDLALPANDGMHALRQKLHEIRQLAISTEEKAKRMHVLMTKEYLARNPASSSPALSSDGDARSLSDEPVALDVGVAALPIDPSNPYNLRPGDLEPTFSPLPHTTDRDMDDGGEEDDGPVLGCMHYKRNVKLQCFDCHGWFNCRYCHDQSRDLPFPHALRRKMTRNMLCMLCQTPQPAAEECMNCGEYAAWYYCPECKLWDNDSNKRIYHCDDCGICRLGEGLGKDFVHCKKCNVCISIATSAAHTCVERATEGPCPLCLDEMFASRAKVVSMPCGHYMHGDCYKDLMAVTYKCPVCSKSAVNMELQWRKLDHEIAAQPMPEDDDELEGLLPQLVTPDTTSTPARRPRTVWIGCNDCGSRSWTPFHWLGLKCQTCDSYNTTQMAPTLGAETETERLIRQQQLHTPTPFTGNAVLRAAGIHPTEVDSVISPPSSPSHLPLPGSPTSTPSSPRRYFVQDDPPRRSSFTTLPTLPTFPEMPRLPRLPNMPNMPNYMPNMPQLELPRFSPYDVFDSLSRSLSPMRYYLQGLDVRDEPHLRERERAASPRSVRSDPTAESTGQKMGEGGAEGGEGIGFWGRDGAFLSTGSDDDDSGSGSDDEDMFDDEDEGEEDDDEEMEEEGDLMMELIGHR